jgi:hypothetical protein
MQTTDDDTDMCVVSHAEVASLESCAKGNFANDTGVLVPNPATVMSAAATQSALNISATPVTLLTVASQWVCKCIGAATTFFITPEYDATKVVDAIDKLQSTLDFLDKKIVAMNDRVDRFAHQARAMYAARKKTSAVHQLRLKKMYEREMNKMEALKFNIESNILHMESVGVMMETVATIKETSHQFQVVSKHVDIARLEGSIEEMFEQRDTSKDIESILNDMHDTHEFDDDDLLRELEETFADDDDDEVTKPSNEGPAVVAVAADVSATATDTKHNNDDSSAGTPLADIAFPTAPTNPLPTRSSGSGKRSNTDKQEQAPALIEA